MIADAHNVTVQESVCIDCDAIDESAVGRARINNEQPVLVRSDFCVMPTHIRSG